MRSPSARSLARKQIRLAPIIPSDGSPEADGDPRNRGPLRKRSCRGDSSCRRSADNDRANDEHGDNDHGGDDDHDEHRDDDRDEHGDDDYPCGDHDDGAADFDNSRLVTASEDDSYSRSPSWSERGRYAVWERSTDASASQEASAPSLEAAHGHTAARSGQLLFPVVGVSGYGDSYGAFRGDVHGKWHHGDDIFAALGTPVVAVANGTINRVGWHPRGGWRLWVRDAAANQFYYAHLSGYAPRVFHRGM